MLVGTWFMLWGLLWAIYFMLDGFDLGVGALIPFIGKSEDDRRAMINSIGPFWDGNEVWLITAGGVTFAAFPLMYAVMFSTLYLPLMLLLLALIFRAVSIEFRAQVDSPGWRKSWDVAFFLGSTLAAIIPGVAFANIFQGIPFDQNHVLQGNIFTLFNPYGIIGGVVFLLLFMQHGLVWLAARTDGGLNARVSSAAGKFWFAALVAAVVFLVATYVFTPLYGNYLAKPALLIVPLLAVAALVMERVYIWRRAWWKAWGASSLFILSVVLFGVIGLYPDMYPSSLNPEWSITAQAAASTPLTLSIMLGVTLVFLPIIIAYQAWAYKTFSGVVKKEDYHY